MHSSGKSASTIGGRAAQRGKKQRGRGKIRQGTPEEEQQLAVLLSELAPTPELCSQVCLGSHVQVCYLDIRPLFRVEFEQRAPLFTQLHERTTSA